MRGICVAAFVAVLAVSCSTGGTPSAEVMGVYGGAANWAAVESPQRAEAYRVIRPGVLKYPRAPDTIGGFEIIDGPVAMDPAAAKELAAILADESIYDFERAKGCEFDPGVAFRMTKGPTAVDILLCFSCDELAAYSGTKRVGGEDFDRARSRLLAIAKRLFPNDEKLASLK